MKTFFTVRTTVYNGPELGPKDTVTVEIQRFDKAGLIVSREKLQGLVIETDVVVPPEDLSPEGGEGRFTIPESAEPLTCPDRIAFRDRFHDEGGDPRPLHDLERMDEEAASMREESDPGDPDVS